MYKTIWYSVILDYTWQELSKRRNPTMYKPKLEQIKCRMMYKLETCKNLENMSIIKQCLIKCRYQNYLGKQKHLNCELYLSAL